MELKWGQRALPPKNTQAELQTVQIIPKYRPNEINRKKSSTFFNVLPDTKYFLADITYENLLAVYLFILNQVLRLLGAEANWHYANTHRFAI